MVFRDRIEAFISDAREKAVGGFSLEELGELFTDFLELAVEEAQALQLPGADKKAYVLEALGYLYDTVAPFIPLPALVAPFRRLIRPIVKQTVLVVAWGVIELIYKRLKKDATPAPV